MEPLPYGASAPTTGAAHAAACRRFNCIYSRRFRRRYISRCRSRFRLPPPSLSPPAAARRRTLPPAAADSLSATCSCQENPSTSNLRQKDLLRRLSAAPSGGSPVADPIMVSRPSLHLVHQELDISASSSVPSYCVHHVHQELDIPAPCTLFTFHFIVYY